VIVLYSKEHVARKLRLTAARSTFNYGGGDDIHKLSKNTADLPDGARVMFTRDVGHHTCGWFKNPDYERCWHLSISYRDPDGLRSRDHDHKESRAWCLAFFGESARLIWTESPKYGVGKQFGVWHYRVFADAHWNPILPRGEVYSRELTEEGWKSWSELQAEAGESGEGTRETLDALPSGVTGSGDG
jgi:hypothetical protein